MIMLTSRPSRFIFFFNDTATTEIYTLSLHDALPIYTPHFRPHRAAAGGPSRPVRGDRPRRRQRHYPRRRPVLPPSRATEDRKSTRLNSSHANISYAVFCLKKKQIPTHLKLPSASPCP